MKYKTQRTKYKNNGNPNFGKYKYNIAKEFLIKEYVKNGKPKYQIANELGCSEQVIDNRLRKFNIRIRILKEACKIGLSHIDGRYSEVHYCIELGCDKKICYCNWLYGSRLCNSCAQKRNIRINGHPFKNRSHTKEAKKKMKDKAVKRIKKFGHPLKGKHRSKETKEKISLAEGGTGTPYENSEYPEEFFKIRSKIRKRDNYTCQGCGKKFDKYSTYLQVHHIDYNKENCSEDNLISLCRRCNMKANFNRDYWFAYFTYIMENKNENNRQTFKCIISCCFICAFLSIL